MMLYEIEILLELPMKICLDFFSSYIVASYIREKELVERLHNEISLRMKSRFAYEF